jgi:tRNA A-37 threonylcarbamoyl transferase component Bud32
MAMTPRNEREIFFAALDRDRADRASFLDDACADDEALRRGVESLLRLHENATSFLSVPVVDQLAAALPGAQDAAVDLSFLGPPSEPGSLGRIDQYEVLDVVGRGGTGVVLRARDTKLLRVVAIKILAAPLAMSGSARMRFVREARAAAAVGDEHVITIHAVSDDGAFPYIVMEFIDGCSLQAFLRDSGPPEVEEIARIGLQIAEGLAAAHRQGLIHRDVKPANILIEDRLRRVKLTDFGLARAVDDASLTQSGYIAGTPLYMSPEQVNGHPIGPRSDLFSLGSVLYELCTGQPAFRAPSTAAVIRRICHEAPQPIREINPEIPPDLCRLIERLHAKEPEDRPASAADVSNWLSRILNRPLTQDQATRCSLPALTPAPPRNLVPRWRWATAALLILVVGLGMSEATGVTEVGRSVIRLFSPEGTLVVEVDDPAVRVTLEGADLVITDAGSQEIRLKPGSYTLQASKEGRLVRQELVTVARDGRQVVRISKEPRASEAWEESVAVLPPAQQVEAVAQRLKELNPGFDGQVASAIRGQAVTGLTFVTDAVSDISPVRALRYLEVLDVRGTVPRGGRLTDLSPLRGLPLTVLHFEDNPVSDLSPLKGMPLKDLGLFRTRIEDLSPLRGMPLVSLGIGHTGVSDLSALTGMALTHLYCDGAPVSDLSPLKGVPLEVLYIPMTLVSDLSPLSGMALVEVGLEGAPVSDLSPLTAMPLRSIRCDIRPDREAGLLRSMGTLETINGRPAAEFWEDPAAAP